MQNKKIIKESICYNKEYFIAVMLISIIFFILFGEGLRLKGFAEKDDWTAVLIASETPNHPQLEKSRYSRGFGQFSEYAFKRDLNLGRFRPAYWAFVTLEAYLFQNSPAGWHLETILSGILSCFLFYIAIRRLGFGILTSYLCCLWIIFAGHSLWEEKQLAEDPAMLLSVIALLFFINGSKFNKISYWDWLGLLSLGLAGLFKESFVLLFPAFLLLRIGLPTFLTDQYSIKSTIDNLRKLIFGSSFLFLVLTLISIYAYNIGEYSLSVVGELSSSVHFSIKHWTKMISQIGSQVSYYIPAVGIAFINPVSFRDRLIRRKFLMILGILMLWIVPQFILYAHSGFTAHYICPAIMAIAIFNGLGLEVLKRRNKKPFFLIFVIIILFSFGTIFYLTPNIKNTLGRKVSLANTLHDTVRHTINSVTSPKDSLLFVTETWWGLGVSFLTQLGKAGVYNPVYQDINPTPMTARKQYSSQLLEEIYLPLRDAKTDELNIIITDRSADDFKNEAALRYKWFDSRDWTHCEFYNSYKLVRFSLNPINLISRTNTITYSVFIRSKY